MFCLEASCYHDNSISDFHVTFKSGFDKTGDQEGASESFLRRACQPHVPSV